MASRIIEISAIRPEYERTLPTVIEDARKIVEELVPAQSLVTAAGAPVAHVADDRIVIARFTITLEDSEAIALGDEIVRRIGLAIPALESLDHRVGSAD
jgi:hypothetical protein